MDDKEIRQIEVTSGKGFKYSEPLALYESRKTKVTVEFKQVPNAQTRKLHHVEMILRQEKCEKGEWLPETRITLKSKDENNKVTDNSLKRLTEMIDVQRELVNMPLAGRTKLYVGDQDVLDVARSLEHIENRAKVIEAIQVLAQKSSLEISELLKAAFSPDALKEKRAKLEELKDQIEIPSVQELDIQKTLAEMPWAFGPEYERLDIRNAGDSGIPDRRLKRVDGLSDILEVKLPSAELLRKDRKERAYIAPDLAQALGQIVGYLEHFYSQYQTAYDDEDRTEVLNEPYGKYYKPKGILLIGRRAAIGKRGQPAHPKLLRRLLSYFHWIDVLTYDDLIHRAANLLDKMST
jgi:hypothetical protein